MNDELRKRIMELEINRIDIDKIDEDSEREALELVRDLIAEVERLERCIKIAKAAFVDIIESTECGYVSFEKGISERALSKLTGNPGTEPCR